MRTSLDKEIRGAVASEGLDAGVFNPEAASDDDAFKALVLDASGISSSERLREAWAFFHPTIRRLRRSGRVIVLGTRPSDCASPPEAVAQRALEGLVRSIGKEVKQGATTYAAGTDFTLNEIVELLKITRLAPVCLDEDF